MTTTADKQPISPDTPQPLQRDFWDGCAEQYQKFVHEGPKIMEPILHHVATAVARHVEGRSQPRVLDVGSATGEPGLSIARMLPEDAQVVITDYAPAMVERAKKRAEGLQLKNTEFAVADMLDLSAFPDASFDDVTGTFCMHLVPDMRGALTEINRVLKPGGMVHLAVWGPPELVEIQQITFKTLAAVASGIQLPHTAGPRYGGHLQVELEAIGFQDARIEEVNNPVKLPKSEVAGFLAGFPPFIYIAQERERRGETGGVEALADKMVEVARQEGYINDEDAYLQLQKNVAHYVTAVKPAV